MTGAGTRSLAYRAKVARASDALRVAYLRWLGRREMQPLSDLAVRELYKWTAGAVLPERHHAAVRQVIGEGA